jgi:hypothetical protein
MPLEIYFLKRSVQLATKYVVNYISWARLQNYVKRILPTSLMSACLSVRMKLGSHWTDYHEIRYLSILGKSVKKIQLLIKMGTLHEDPRTFTLICGSVFLRMRNISDKSYGELKT